MRKLKDSNTVRNYVCYTRQYASLLNAPRTERLQALLSLPPRLRGWVLDALVNYARFLDDFFADVMDSEDFSYYELYKRKVRGVKRERVVNSKTVSSIEDIVRFYNAIQDPKVRLYFLVKLFSGLRHRDLQLVEVSSFEVVRDTGIAIAWVTKLETHKRALFCIIPKKYTINPLSQASRRSL